MKPGDVVLTPLPQADGQVKPRPAVVQAVPGFDESIGPQDDDFVQSGLKVASVIRLGYVTVLMPEDVICRIGSVSPTRLKHLLAKAGRILYRTREAHTVTSHHGTRSTAL